jgi:hypothetical protein
MAVRLMWNSSSPISNGCSGGGRTQFGFPWWTPFLGRLSLESAVGKAWISLNSLVRIEPFQWVTGEFR